MFLGTTIMQKYFFYYVFNVPRPSNFKGLQLFPAEGTSHFGMKPPAPQYYKVAMTLR